MSEKILNETRDHIRFTADVNLDWLDQCQRLRGEIDDKMLDQFMRDEWGLPVKAAMYELAAKAIGKNVPQRDYANKVYPYANTGLCHTRDKAGHVLMFYGAIGAEPGEISSDKFNEVLWGIPSEDTITIRFNSPGGRYKDSCEIADQISKRSGTTEAIIDGYCASGASVVAMRCSRIGIGLQSYIMVHFARVTLKPSLTVDDLDLAAKKMRETNLELAQQYLHRWKGTTAELVDAMDEEREFTGYDAVRAGLADYVSPKAAIATRDEINRSVKEFNPAAWRERERKNFTKYEVLFRRWKHVAECMAND